MNSNNNVIHCKVSFNNQLRRFQFTGTGFASLYEEVQKLLALNNEFVLKYKDNEGDMITISTDLELGCALKFSEDDVLRLNVELIETKKKWNSVPVCRQGGNREGKWAHKKERIIHKRDHLKTILAGFPQGELTAEETSRKNFLQTKLNCIEHCLKKFECGENTNEGGRKTEDRWVHKKEKMIHKRDHLKLVLSSLSERELTPEESARKSFIQAKLNSIDACLNKWQCREGKTEGCEKKWGEFGRRWENSPENREGCMKKRGARCEEKTRNQSQPLTQPDAKEHEGCRRKWDRHGQSSLSREAIEEITSLKARIFPLKERLVKTKFEIISKKNSLRDAKDAQVDVLKNEIRELKLERFNLRTQLVPLQVRIRSIKQSAKSH